MTDRDTPPEVDGQEQPPVEDQPDETVRRSAATVLVDLATHRYSFGVSDSGEAYALPKKGPRVVLMLRGGKASLRGQLARAYYSAIGKVPPQQALADALLVVQGMAEEADPEPLHQRVARHDGALWLDLGDRSGRAVRITPDGWSVESSPPVLFRRTPLTGELPTPAPGGDLDGLWAWLNVAKEDRPLVAAWLVSTLYDTMPHPVLGLFGEQGTGKTTAAKVLASVLDPSPVPVRKPPKDADSWVVAAAGSWVVAIDNVSQVPDWLSDSLCRVVTGEGDVRRKLYTDGEYAVFAYRRCVILNGIDLGALNGDLADRLLSIQLDIIGEENRRDEQDLWPGWATAHPRILGAVLDLAVNVMAALPGVALARRPRMADFARILAAVDKVDGTQGYERYLAGQRSLAGDALTGDSFIVRISEVLAGTTWEGTSRELLALATPQDETWRPPRDWPNNARAVTTRLHRQAPVMRKAKWHIANDAGANHSKIARWTIAPPVARDSRDSDPQHPQTRTHASDQHKQARSPAGQTAGQTPLPGTSDPQHPHPDPQHPQTPAHVPAGHRAHRGSAGHAGQQSPPSRHAERCDDCGHPANTTAHAVACGGVEPAGYCRVCAGPLDPALSEHWRRELLHPSCEEAPTHA